MTKIIAFEGIDGTGKSVQMERLCEALKARGLSVLEISFPMYDTFFGEMIGRYLSAKDGIGVFLFISSVTFLLGIPLGIISPCVFGHNYMSL